MSDLFGRRTLAAVVREVRERLGGRARHDDLVEGTKATISLSEYEHWQESAFRQAVIEAAKVKAAGLDEVMGVGEDEVAPLRLFTVEEFESKARAVARLSKGNRDTVYRLAEACMEAHGTAFDPDLVLREEGAA